jgi:hypothetical protein
MKYYTPTIEEFHVGFEYENKMIDGYWQWHGEVDKVVFTKDTGLQGIIDYPNLVRVKHLDREDIESFGFDFITTKQSKTNDFFMKQVDDPRHKEAASIGIGVCYVSHQVVIEFEIDTTKETKGPWYIDSNAVFAGKIKNKSELGVILKQIGVI